MLFHARGSAPCIPGAEPKRRREQGRTTRPAGGGVPGWSPARPAAAVPGGGACLLCRLPTPPLASLSAPYPPAPLPRRGRGCPKVYFAGGFAPGTPALNRLRHLQSLPLLCPAGACLLCRLPTPPLASLSAPYPPAPLPRRGRGRPRFFHARGSAPCIPGAEPKRRREQGRTTRPAGACPAGHPPDSAAAVPGGGRACFVACCPPAFSLLPAPYPPAPLPRRGRGSPKVYFAGGFAPGTPALNRLRHLQSLPYRFPAQGSLRFGVKPTERLSLEQCR